MSTSRTVMAIRLYIPLRTWKRLGFSSNKAQSWIGEMVKVFQYVLFSPRPALSMRCYLAAYRTPERGLWRSCELSPNSFRLGSSRSINPATQSTFTTPAKHCFRESDVSSRGVCPGYHAACRGGSAGPGRGAQTSC